MLVGDQLQDVQRPACMGERLEIDFEQAGGSSRVLLVENRSASSQFNNSDSDVYGALKSYCEWYDACDAIRATPTQDNVTGRTRRDAQAFRYCKSSLNGLRHATRPNRTKFYSSVEPEAVHVASEVAP